MLDGKFLNEFISQVANRHQTILSATNFQKEYGDMDFSDTFDEINMVDFINPEWEPPHDKWPRDYDNREKDPDEC